MPTEVGLRELRHHTREVIESARHVGRIAITDRGEVIGYIVGPEPPSGGRPIAKNPSIEALLRELDESEPYDSGLSDFVREERAASLAIELAERESEQ